VLYFTFDGHGSTRVLTDLAGAIAELYTFDAYGNAIGFNPSVALTEFLYSGEQFDSKIGLQYLRARYYDPATGRFNRLDPFFGNLIDPQSLHKYVYVHNEPTNGIDPSGESAIFATLTIVVTALSLISFVGIPIVGSVYLSPGIRNIVFSPWTSFKTTSRLSWQKVINSYLKPRNHAVAAYLMEHSLQDSPNNLNFGQGHFITQKIRESKEYKEFKNNLAKEFSPGDIFENKKRLITFTSTDLFLGIHKATMTVSGRINENGELVDFRAQLYDKYDFALVTGYHGAYGGYYGYGTYNGYSGYYYGAELRSMAFGVLATVANNMAWSDQQVGIIVPYEFTVNIE
jgi:RHS repeat-associated protein